MVAATKPTLPAVQLLQSYWKWLWEGGCQIIRSEEPELGIQPMVPRLMQEQLYETILTQAMAGKPVRIVGLKARKHGFSTEVQSLAYFAVKSMSNFYAQTVAHTEPSTRDIFRIAARMYVNDPDWEKRPKWPGKGEISFLDQHDSVLNTRTFGGHYISSSATIPFAHISELAKVPREPQFVEDQLLSLLGAVPDNAFSFIFIESTANRADKSGEFERRYWEATRQAGNFEAVFYPWFIEPSYSMAGPLLEPLADDKERRIEGELVERFPFLSEDQLRWRRKKIVDLGGLLKFDQEFPDSDETAFQKATGKVFPALNRATHNFSAEVRELLKEGYRLYRAFDWGGSDPFVCLWLAHKPREHARLTIDIERCPELWREMRGLIYDDHGRPVDRNNHGVDALRYAATFWDFKGYVHVWQEHFDPDFAAEGRWIQDCAHDVLDLTGDLPIQGSVGDRSRPDCITAFQSQGIPTQAYKLPDVTGRPGEIMYGIDRLNELIVASHPIVYPPEPLSPMEEYERKRSQAAVTFGWPDLQAMHDQSQWRETRRPAPAVLGATW